MNDNFGAPINPVEPAKKSNTTLIIVIVVVVVLLCCCCSLAGVLWQYGDTIMQALGI
jgi:flagellar basal body-associated protein FliL